MPKYNIRVTAEIEIEAPNVAKAYKIADKKIKVIGQYCGSSRDRHERDMWRSELRVLSVVCAKPVRVR